MIDWDALATGPCMTVFGEAAEYIAPGGRLPMPIVGVFDEAYVPVTPLGDMGHQVSIPANITDAAPVLGVQLSQFRYAPIQGGFIRLPPRPPARPKTLVYEINEVEADGHGAAILKLNLVQET